MGRNTEMACNDSPIRCDDRTMSTHDEVGGLLCGLTEELALGRGRILSYWQENARLFGARKIDSPPAPFTRRAHESIT